MNITNRTTHDVQQGTGAWLRLREGFATASEAPAAAPASQVDDDFIRDMAAAEGQ